MLGTDLDDDHADGAGSAGGLNQFTHDVSFTARSAAFRLLLGGRYRRILPRVMERLRDLTEEGAPAPAPPTPRAA